jgi:hypothetical protein
MFSSDSVIVEHLGSTYWDARGRSKIMGKPKVGEMNVLKG